MASFSGFDEQTLERFADLMALAKAKGPGLIYASLC